MASWWLAATDRTAPPEGADLFGSEPVEDAIAVTSGRHETNRGKGAEVERGSRDALADLSGEFVNVAFALTEHIDDPCRYALS